MRKAFLIAIAACCIGTSKVYGQIGEPRNDLAIGFNAGYTLNQVMFNPTIQQKFKGAPTFGFTARYTCEKYFKSLCSIQLEVNYTNLGWEELIETSDD
ncbi:outer membrane beta-barrel protein, partial [Paraprevotella clara]